MIGAFVGDCAGSEWEFTRNKNVNIELFSPAAQFTDDSVCTAAISQWLLSGKEDAGPFLLEMGRFHLGRGFGGKFLEWLRSDRPEPYGSWGNGSAMRASACALWGANDQEAMDLARRSAIPTHGHPDAVAGAQALAMAIRWTMQGLPLPAVLGKVESAFSYPGLCSLNPDEVRPSHRFDVSCAGTVPLALACASHGGSFEGAMRLCLSMGGDADTLAAIAGPVAEAAWGIPNELFEKASALCGPEDMVLEPILAIYGHPKVRGRINGGGVGSPLRWR